MDTGKDYKEAIEKLEEEFRRKGYLKKFHLVMNDPWGTQFDGTLKECLTSYVTAYLKSYKVEDDFRLYTFARYKSDTDNIYCKFEMTFDETKGFKASSLEIDDVPTYQKRFYRFDNNRQIHPAATLKALFPRPKPWEFWKRKFRHK